MSNENNEAEMMFLSSSVLSRLIYKLSLISNKIEPSTVSLISLKVNGEIPMCSPDLTFKCLYASP